LAISVITLESEKLSNSRLWANLTPRH
jgi:hypothetical protein